MSSASSWMDEGGQSNDDEAGAFPRRLELPRAFRRDPSLTRDMLTCLMIAHRRGCSLSVDDAYWLASLRRRFQEGDIGEFDVPE